MLLSLLRAVCNSTGVRMTSYTYYYLVVMRRDLNTCGSQSAMHHGVPVCVFFRRSSEHRSRNDSSSSTSWSHDSGCVLTSFGRVGTVGMETRLFVVVRSIPTCFQVFVSIPTTKRKSWNSCELSAIGNILDCQYKTLGTIVSLTAGLL